MSKKWVGTLAACLLGITSVAYGQVIEMSADVVQEGENAPQQMQIMSFSTNDGFSSTQMFDGGNMVLASPGMGGGFSYGGDSFSMLNSKDVQSELNLVDEQVEQLRDVQKRFAEKMKAVTSEMRGEGGRFNLDTAMIEKLKRVSQEIREQKQKEMEGLLLPEQMERLKQVALQTKMQQQGAVNALGSEEVAEAIGLEKDQLDELREKAKEIAAEVRKEIEQVKENARKKLLAELTSDQQDKLKDLMGDKFERSEEEQSGSRFNFRNRR